MPHIAPAWLPPRYKEASPVSEAFPRLQRDIDKFVKEVAEQPGIPGYPPLEPIMPRRLA